MHLQGACGCVRAKGMEGWREVRGRDACAGCVRVCAGTGDVGMFGRRRAVRVIGHRLVAGAVRAIGQ